MTIEQLINKLESFHCTNDVVIVAADMGYGGNREFKLDQIEFNQSTGQVEISSTDNLC